MNAKLLKSISSQVYRRFPEVAGCQPKVQPHSGSGGDNPNQTFLLIYRGTAKSPTGKSLPRIVRVTANLQGKILKVSTSR
jgi:hypothetical protein